MRPLFGLQPDAREARPRLTQRLDRRAALVGAELPHRPVARACRSDSGAGRSADPSVDDGNEAAPSLVRPSALDAFGAQARAQIPGDVDAVVAVTTMIAASLDGLRAPVISWDDASPASLVEYYPQFERLSARTAQDVVTMGQRAARNVQLAMY